MKKCILLCLLPLLLLTGCANADSDLNETTQPVTKEVGYYIPGSEIETQTGNAVRAYQLPEAGYQWIGMAGDRLMIASNGETAKLSVLSGIDAVQEAQLEIDSKKLSGGKAIFSGFVYYDKETNDAVYLDLQLHESGRIPMPEEIVGEPVFAADGSEIFYCTGTQLRSIEAERKIDRLIKTVNTGKLSLLDTYCDGDVVSCNMEYDNGKKETQYISTQNGQTLKTDDYVKSLYTGEDCYFAIRQEGTMLQRIVGAFGAEPLQLTAEDTKVYAVADLGSVIGSTEVEDGIVLNCYDIKTGRKTAATVIQGVNNPSIVVGDKWSRCVWILTHREDRDVLLCWDMSASAVQEDVVYHATLFTAENPDTVSLKALNDRVNSINKTYGTRVRIWQDAVQTTGNYEMVPEYQVPVIQDMLDKLEATLAEFPKNFVLKSIASRVRICLVRSVDSEQKSVQFWQNKDAYIAIAAGTDVRSEFIKNFAPVVDSHVLGNSAMYDYWDGLNPDGFAYGTEDKSLVSGDKRAFYDQESMTSAVNDRSKIFWQAMLPDNAEVFKSDTMQAKLKLICQAIRNAWRLEREEAVLPWEQYLREPVAFVK